MNSGGARSKKPFFSKQFQRVDASGWPGPCPRAKYTLNRTALRTASRPASVAPLQLAAVTWRVFKSRKSSPAPAQGVARTSPQSGEGGEDKDKKCKIVNTNSVSKPRGKCLEMLLSFTGKCSELHLEAWSGGYACPKFRDGRIFPCGHSCAPLLVKIPQH